MPTKKLKRKVKKAGAKKAAKRKTQKKVQKKRIDFNEESGFVSLFKMFTAPVK